MGNARQTIYVPRSLTTERLMLRCPRPEDGPALHTAILDSRQRLQPGFNWTTGAVLTIERSTASARFAQWRFWAGRELQFDLFLRKTAQFIGVCGLCHPDWTVPQFEVSYWLRSSCEGHSYMTEAATAVVNMAFAHLKAKRVVIRCDPGNKSSIALARRLGFARKRCLDVGERPFEETLFVRTAL
jgi:RimJ/RimL family protein N-acetyltransferase